MGISFDFWPKRDKKVLWICTLMGWKGELSFLDLSKRIRKHTTLAYTIMGGGGGGAKP
jgi:hypothetical protein